MRKTLYLSVVFSLTVALTACTESDDANHEKDSSGVEVEVHASGDNVDDLSPSDILDISASEVLADAWLNDLEEVQSCAPPTPFLLEGECVQCTDDSHCRPGEGCEESTHTCSGMVCDVECCYCQEPYPACIQSGGGWICVECLSDADCPTGEACDPIKFACSGLFPEEPYCPGCAVDSDCWDPTNALDLVCDTASGCCYDRLGGCDYIGAVCLGEPASGCVGFSSAATATLPVDLPQIGACTCSHPWVGSVSDIQSCLPDGCLDDGCLGQTVCAGPQLAQQVGLFLDYDEGLCLDVHLFVGD